MCPISSTRIVGLIAVVCAVIVAPQALATPKVVAPPDVEPRQEQSNPPAAAGPHNNSVTAFSRVAAIKALQRRSVALDAAYRKLYPGAYSQALPKSGKAAVWKFPACSPSAAAPEYDSYIYSGDPCIWSGPAATAPTIVLAPAIESGVVSRSPVSRMNPVVCNGQSEYEYVYSGCAG